MNSRMFSVDDDYDLLALHRGLMEARFCKEPNDLDVSGSPILSRIHKEIVSILKESEKSVGGDKQQWQKWLTLDVSRREWLIAIERARNSSWWSRLKKDEKIEATRDLLAPFEITPEQIEIFIKCVEHDKEG